MVANLSCCFVVFVNWRCVVCVLVCLMCFVVCCFDWLLCCPFCDLMCCCFVVLFVC